MYVLRRFGSDNANFVWEGKATEDDYAPGSEYYEWGYLDATREIRATAVFEASLSPDLAYSNSPCCFLLPSALLHSPDAMRLEREPKNGLDCFSFSPYLNSECCHRPAVGFDLQNSEDMAHPGIHLFEDGECSDEALDLFSLSQSSTAAGCSPRHEQE